MSRIVTGLCLFAGVAWGQSPALIEGVRLHRAALAATARAELSACTERKPDVDKAACADPAKLSLLTGYLLLSEGEAAEAAKVLKAHKAPKGLAAFHGYYLGEAQAWSGQRPEAVKTLTRARKGAPGWLASRIAVRVAELQLDLGQAAKALPVLEAAAKSEGTPELVYARALARRATGDEAGAAADFKKLVLESPTHPHAELAWEALKVDGALPALTAEEQLTRAASLLAAGKAKDALGELDRLEGLPPPLQARRALLRGQALIVRGRDADGLKALDAAAAGPKDVAVQALLAKAKRLMRVGDNPGARKAFLSLDEKHRGAPGVDEAAYLAAWIAMTSGDTSVAAQEFETFEANYGRSRKRDEARWFRGWSRLRGGDALGAREVWRTLARDYGKSSLVPQALYWAARCLELAQGDAAKDAADGGTADGPKGDAQREYRAVIEGFPGTFYAVMASERLQAAGVEPPPLFTQKPESKKVKLPAALALAKELSAAGLLPDASEAVAQAVKGVRGAADALTFGHALQGLEEFGAAHALAARHLWGQVYGAKEPTAIALMYPRAFEQAVDEKSGKWGLDPNLAWAIMRRESAFRAEVTSAADARGLMQIIPPTARAIAARLKLDPPPDPDELYAPERNIEFGTWYLSALLDRMGHPALTAASYNAGPNAVVKWMQQRGSMPLDAWVEEIPYRETRGYVKQVMADYVVYQHLYGEGPVKRPSLELPTPKATGVSF